MYFSVPIYVSSVPAYKKVFAEQNDSHFRFSMLLLFLDNANGDEKDNLKMTPTPLLWLLILNYFLVILIP